MANFIQPVVGMMGVTAGVWGWMYIKRLRYMSQNDIQPEDIDTPDKWMDTLPDTVNYPAYNLQNLFEMPVLFYITCLSFKLLDEQAIWVYWTTWSYVLLRALHSLIQCGRNQVMPRFIAYFISCILLWVMLIRLAVSVFR